MVHEARIVRMNAEHDPSTIQKWLGDSIGWWEGDTLVVETTNFRDTPNFSRGSANMVVTEYFEYENPDKVIYRFTVKTLPCGLLLSAASTRGHAPTSCSNMPVMKRTMHWKVS